MSTRRSSTWQRCGVSWEGPSWGTDWWRRQWTVTSRHRIQLTTWVSFRRLRPTVGTFMLTVDGRISDFYMGRDGFLLIFSGSLKFCSGLNLLLRGLNFDFLIKFSSFFLCQTRISSSKSLKFTKNVIDFYFWKLILIIRFPSEIKRYLLIRFSNIHPSFCFSENGEELCIVVCFIFFWTCFPHKISYHK